LTRIHSWTYKTVEALFLIIDVIFQQMWTKRGLLRQKLHLSLYIEYATELFYKVVVWFLYDFNLYFMIDYHDKCTCSCFLNFST